MLTFCEAIIFYFLAKEFVKPFYISKKWLRESKTGGWRPAQSATQCVANWIDLVKLAHVLKVRIQTL